MGEVRTDFTGDSQQLEKVLHKLEQQNIKLIEQNRQLASASKKASDDAVSGFGEVNEVLRTSTGELKNMALGFLGGGGVIGAVAKVVEIYSDWMKTIEELGAKHKTFTDNFVSDLSRSRDAQQAPQIEGWLKNVPGVTGTQAQAIFGAVTHEGQTMPLQRREGITEAVAKMAPIKPKEGDLAETGRVAGHLGEMFGGKSPEAIAGLSLGLQQMPKVDSGFLTGHAMERAVSTMKEAGVSPDEAMAEMLVAVGKGQQRPSGVLAAAEAVYKPGKAIKTSRGHPQLTAEEKAKNRFVAASGPERLKLLKTDREIRDAVLGDNAIMYAQISDAEVKVKLAEMHAMEQPGYIEGQVAGIAASSEGAKAVVAQEQAAATYQAQKGDTAKGDRLARAEARFQKYQAGRSAWQQFGGAADWKLAKWQQPENPEELFAKWDPDSRGMNDQAQREEAALGKVAAGGSGQAIVDELRALREDLKKPTPAAVQAGARTK